MHKRIRTTGLAVLFASFSFTAQATTLADALAQAYQTNPQILAQQAALRATDENVISARANLLPILTQTLTLDKSLDFTLPVTGTTIFSRTRTQPSTYNLNTALTMQLWDGGADDLTVEANQMAVLAARQALIQVEQSILLSTVQAYMNVRRDQQFVRLAENNVRVLREQVRAAKDRFEVGEVTRTDVAQAEARLAAALSQLAANNGALQRSISSYIAVVGSAPTNLQNPPTAPKIPNAVETAEAVAIKKHPRVLQAQFNAKAAELVSAATHKNRKPVINAQISHSVGGQFRDSNVSTNTLNGRIQAQWTLYQGNRLNSNRRRDIALHQQALANVQQSGYLTRQGLRDAYTNWQVSTASITSNKQQVLASQVAFDGVKEEAKLGARTTLDALNAEQELLSARSQLVSAIRDQYVAQYQVLSEMGLLTAEHLGLGVPIYNPAVNYNAVTTKQLGVLDGRRLDIFNKLKKRNGN
jgi:outer membrane protein